MPRIAPSRCTPPAPGPAPPSHLHPPPRPSLPSFPPDKEEPRILRGTAQSREQSRAAGGLYAIRVRRDCANRVHAGALLTSGVIMPGNLGLRIDRLNPGLLSMAAWATLP